MARAGLFHGVGNRIAPPRFLLFALVATAGMVFGTLSFGWHIGVMAGFDLAALIFLLTCLPLLNDEAEAMREAARRNDANRAVLLALTVGVTLVILAAIAAELTQQGSPDPLEVTLIVVTLMLAWLFSNVIYALHYAHLFYTRGDDGKDGGGLSVPGTDEPDYRDMLYFAFTLGMTFQTSDVDIESRRIRWVAIFHSLVAFVFNLGVVAFTINVLGG